MKVLFSLLRFARALASELSDQSAYERYLLRTSRTHSGSEWRRFIDHRHQLKYRQGKCC